MMRHESELHHPGIIIFIACDCFYSYNRYISITGVGRESPALSETASLEARLKRLEDGKR
jgi:hypothetical protein